MTAEVVRRDQTIGVAGGPYESAGSRARPEIAPITVRVPEAARMLGIGRSRVYELILSGDIETLKLGRATLVPVAGLHALIDRLRREQADI